MAVQSLDSMLDINAHLSEELIESMGSQDIQLDARRRLEEKIEEIRLVKEIQDFDFDIE